ncbi:MAG: hypothetical protein AB8B60_17375 [Sulfitobacter sp.]
MKRLRPFWLLPVITVALVACTQFPALEHTRTDDLEAADYPALVPIEPILAANAGPAPDPVETENTLNARLAGLRARADRMRGAVLSGPEKQRLEQGLR